MSKSSDALNAIFAEDPKAVNTLFSFRAISSEECTASFFADGQFVISALGMINRVLEANGLEPVAIQVTEESYRHEIVGFCDYKL